MNLKNSFNLDRTGSYSAEESYPDGGRFGKRNERKGKGHSQKDDLTRTS